MRRYSRLNLCLLLLGLMLGSAVQGAGEDVEQIVRKANLAAYYQGNNGKATVTMTITDKKGQERNREFIILRQDVEDGGDQNYFLYFKLPTDVRKMTYMVHKHAAVDKDDDRWLYLPALSLVKRIAAGDKRTSFVGSDFLYEDVSGRSLLEDTHELVSTGDKLYVVKNTPKDPASVEFSYFTVAIEKTTFIPMRMEFFDKTGALYRVIESTEVREIQGHPTVVKSLVKDLKTGSQTEMAFTDVTYDIEMKDIFTERYLRNPPREVTR